MDLSNSYDLNHAKKRVLSNGATPSSPLSSFSNTMLSSSVSPAEFPPSHSSSERDRLSLAAAKLFMVKSSSHKSIKKKKSKKISSSDTDVLKRKAQNVSSRGRSESLVVRPRRSDLADDSDNENTHSDSSHTSSSYKRRHRHDDKSRTSDTHMSDSEHDSLSDHESPHETDNSDMTDLDTSDDDRKSSSQSSSSEDDEKELQLPDRKRPIPVSAIHNMDRSGRTMLFKYASRGDYDTCLLLLKHGAQLNISDYAGWSPLHEACLEGHTKVVSLFLSYGAHVDCPGGDGDTPLHDAIGNGHYEVIRVLLSYGACLTAMNDQNQSPLEAAKERLYEFDEILWNPEAAARASQKRPSNISKTKSTDSSGKRRNPIMSDTSDEESERDESDQEVDPEERVAALEAKKIVDVLQEWQDMSMLVTRRNDMGQTCLHEAAIQGRHDLVRRYVEYGADIQAADTSGWTPLHEAALKGHSRVVKTLLEFGANVSPRGVEDDTPLHDAASNGHLDIVKMLLEYGANPLIQNDHGKTPLDLVSHSDKSSAQITDLLNRPLDSWTPHKQPLYVPQLLKPVIRQGATDNRGGITSDASDRHSLPPNQSSALTLNTSAGPKVTVGGLDAISPQTAPYPFAWGGLDPQSGPFASAREEKKFKALLKSIEKNATENISVQGNSTRKSTGSSSKDASSSKGLSQEGRDRQSKKNEKRKQLRLVQDEPGSSRGRDRSETLASDSSEVSESVSKQRKSKKHEKKVEKKEKRKKEEKIKEKANRKEKSFKRRDESSDSEDNLASQQIIDSFSSSEEEMDPSRYRIKDQAKSETVNPKSSSSAVFKLDSTKARKEILRNTAEKIDHNVNASSAHESAFKSHHSEGLSLSSKAAKELKSKGIETHREATRAKVASESATDQGRDRPSKKPRVSEQTEQSSSTKSHIPGHPEEKKEQSRHKRTQSSSEIEATNGSSNQDIEHKKKKKKRMVLAGYQSASAPTSELSIHNQMDVVIEEQASHSRQIKDTIRETERKSLPKSNDDLHTSVKTKSEDQLQMRAHKKLDAQVTNDDLEPNGESSQKTDDSSGKHQELDSEETLFSHLSQLDQSDSSNPVPLKKKKKSRLGISGYQKVGDKTKCHTDSISEENRENDISNSTVDERGGEVVRSNVNVADDRQSVHVSPISQPETKAKSEPIDWAGLRTQYGMPLYVFYPTTPQDGDDGFVIDLQLALALGYRTGRELLQDYPELLPESDQDGALQGRVASQNEKDAIQSSMVGFGVCHTLLDRMIRVKGEGCRRWLKLVSSPQGYNPSNPLEPITTPSEAEQPLIEGLKLAGVDLQFIPLDNVVRLFLESTAGHELTFGYGKHLLKFGNDRQRETIFVHVSIDASSPDNPDSVQLLPYQPPLPNLSKVSRLLPVSARKDTHPIPLFSSMSNSPPLVVSHTPLAAPMPSHSQVHSHIPNKPIHTTADSNEQVLASPSSNKEPIGPKPLKYIHKLKRHAFPN